MTFAHDDWLIGGGVMGECLRGKDWSQTPLGPIDRWPASLRTTVSLALNSNFPISIAWGPRHTQIYNDGYWPICGVKHPHALGQDFSECWATAFPVIGDAFRSALSGTTAFLEDQRMFLDRLGFLEETFFTFSFSPIRDETGQIVGLFHPVTETTAKMIGQRRTRCLRDLAEIAAGADSVTEGFTRAAQALSAYPHDVPFALFYETDPAAQAARLRAWTGLRPEAPGCPQAIDLTADSRSWPLSEVVRTGQSLHLEEVSDRFAPLVCDEYPEPIRSARLTPLFVPGGRQLAGILVVGLSPRLPSSELFLGFHDLLGGAVGSVIASASARQSEHERAAALEQLDRAKTEFFSNVSHELRTPLTLILGPLEEELAREADGPPSQRSELLATAHRNAQRLLKLVNTLLDFSRIQAGRMETAAEETDLAMLTADLASNFRSACERAGLELVVECPPLAQRVFIDRDMWEKIVLNLLSNAFKFTFEGRIRISLRRTGEDLELAVSDTGIGIAEHELSRVFDRFHRVKGAAGRTHEGSGIGLALVHELARLQGGAVSVSSTEGHGATFTVSLPMSRLTQPQDMPSSPPKARRDAAQDDARLRDTAGWLGMGDDHQPASDRAATPTSAAVEGAAADARPRIVWADDNADMRAYVKRLLEPAYALEAVCDGEEALAAIRREPPDLVLSDVMMPRMDGFALLQALRADEETRTLPVVLLSARAGDEARIEGRKAGANEYLVKPFSARELLAVVNGQVEQARLRRELTAMRLASITAEAERARALAEARNQAKSAFLANMSHEIRTPMNAIIGLTHLMGRETRDVLQRDRLGKIDGAAKHLLQVINDILDLSKVEAGKIALEDVEFSVDELVSRAFEMVGELARKKGLELVLDTDHLPSRLRGDPTRLLQSLVNLLSNAVKFTEHGWVGLRARLLDRDDQAVRVRFEVQDTGPGIATERQDALFAPFEQADNSTTRKYGGTGLGLTLTRHFARLMGGDAGLLSSPGNGSTFWLTATFKPASEASAGEPPIVLGGMRALLVDDLPEALAAIGDQLTMLGMKVDPESSGPAGLRKMSAEMTAGRPYDVMLIDWQMKPLDGIETVRRMRELLGDAMPPCILISAFDEEQMLHRAREVHVEAVLAKPITSSALHDTLARLLQHIEIPTTPHAAFGEAQAVLLQTHKGRRVLLAEDNPINREVAEELLTLGGLRVECAENGMQAVEKALDRPFDLVLMDMQMPVLDGLEATRQLRSAGKLALPIVAMTANAFSEDRAACLAAGMNDHLAKPITPIALYAMLLRWLPATEVRSDG